MRKKLAAEERRSTAVFTTLRLSEREQVQQYAEAAGLTMSSAVRWMILRELSRNTKAVQRPGGR